MGWLAYQPHSWGDALVLPIPWGGGLVLPIYGEVARRAGGAGPGASAGGPARRGSAGGLPHQSRLVGEDHRLDAVAQLQLVQEMGDVRLHRGLADVEAGRDLGVGQASRDLFQYLRLTLGQAFELSGLGLGRLWTFGELLDQPLRDRRGEQGLASGDDADGADQVFG